MLLVDDTDDSRVLTKWFFDTLGYAVDSARSAEEALSLFDPEIHAVVFTDNSMPGMTGAQLSHAIKERSPGTPIVMHTGNPPDDLSCVDLLIPKPANLIEVEQNLSKLLVNWRAGG
jgi:CheY-like chemotaxis protein